MKKSRKFYHECYKAWVTVMGAYFRLRNSSFIPAIDYAARANPTGTSSSKDRYSREDFLCDVDNCIKIAGMNQTVLGALFIRRGLWRRRGKK